MTLAALWTRIKAIPDWLIALVLTLLFLKVVDYRAVQRTRREMLERQRTREAEAQAGNERAVREVSDELHTRRTEADAARAGAPVGRGPDELRESDPSLHDLVFGTDPGSRDPRQK
jgi:hypothetical protein